ncbi:FtsH protease activity modulator HflK [Lyticum sinuosum]|uniref:Protein HflK n=1 Tax=Lyticum sinuosum TaxID=1332059 RepID=A0AAE5AHS4_9RICK|nr:FtsH protease activity modulator HflK [Lyticum sinuosum]MDZ5761326.1 Protease modulator HflK [Lyticum sinuosum]
MIILDTINTLKKIFYPEKKVDTDFNIENPWAEKNTTNNNDNNESKSFNNDKKNFWNIFPEKDKKNNNIKYIKIIVVGLIIGWLSTGFYTVNPDEQGVVLLLGKYNRTSTSGLNWKLPDPIETIEKVSVTRMQKESIGLKQGTNISSYNKYLNSKSKVEQKLVSLKKLIPNLDDNNSVQSKFSSSNNEQNDFYNENDSDLGISQDEINNSIIEESQMLTGDENIVDMHFYVQWRIKDAKDYLFNIRDSYGENTVRFSAESAMREVVGTTKLYDVLSEKRQKVEESAKKILQNILDKYKAGIEVHSLGILYSYVPPEVRNAYRDIQSAKADKERFINQATAYRNSVIPRTKAEAQAKIEEANSYKIAKIDEAIGNIMRYNAMYKEFKKNPDIIKNNLYIESMENFYGNIKNKIISQSSSNNPHNLTPIVPLLLNQKDIGFEISNNDNIKTSTLLSEKNDVSDHKKVNNNQS